MTAYRLVAAALPAPIKARLRGKGRHRRPGRPMLVDYRVTPGRHKVRTVWDDLDDLDPSMWQKETT